MQNCQMFILTLCTRHSSHNISLLLSKLCIYYLPTSIGVRRYAALDCAIADLLIFDFVGVEANACQARQTSALITFQAHGLTFKNKCNF
jgi:hypothetical protein